MATEAAPALEHVVEHHSNLKEATSFAHLYIPCISWDDEQQRTDDFLLNIDRPKRSLKTETRALQNLAALQPKDRLPCPSF